MDMDEIMIAADEIALDGAVVIAGSKSTLYRWRNAINGYLEKERCSWRVKASPKDMTLTMVN